MGNQRLGDEVISVNSRGNSQKQDKLIDPPPTRPELEDQLNELTALKEVEVFRVIKDINTSKSSGINNVRSFALKQAFGFLIPEVTHMLNLSLKTSTFPHSWKKALVIPIPKTGSPKLQTDLTFTTARQNPRKAGAHPTL